MNDVLIGRYVNRWPGTFSRSTPDRLWALMTAAWQSGATPPDCRIVEDCGNWVRNVRWVLAAKGAVVPELNCRHGRRLAKRKERTAAKRKAPLRPLPQLNLLLQHFDCSTTPQEPEFNVLPIATPPSDEEIDQFSINELRRRCKLLQLNAAGSAGVLRTRLRVHFNGLAGVVVAASTATLSTLAGGITSSSESNEDGDSESEDEHYLPRPEDDEDDEDDEEEVRDGQGEWHRRRLRRRVQSTD